jgi:hypothetical protein
MLLRGFHAAAVMHHLHGHKYPRLRAREKNVSFWVTAQKATERSSPLAR